MKGGSISYIIVAAQQWTTCITYAYHIYPTERREYIFGIFLIAARGGPQIPSVDTTYNPMVRNERRTYFLHNCCSLQNRGPWVPHMHTTYILLKAGLFMTCYTRVDIGFPRVHSTHQPTDGK
ncbi:hypothetical protein CEXT_161691 [Caerostris extrusa]|uniref:Uncharacterized protein n=1 Tax=Caerostris extrusa TaxID=172846 RepID=A0AAV4XZZ2_CAEEX|nr:hypothetical protein CEXT_161691 [Caerostris extrusa]